MSTECKICNNETLLIEKRMRKAGSSRLYRRCLACDFIFLDDQFVLSPESEFAVYENHENSIDDLKYVAYFKRYIDAAIRDYVAPGDLQCLDFGSGPEPVLARVLERDFGWSVDIYDKFYATSSVYEGREYDLITSTEVVEHFSDPMQYFRLFKKLLRPGGILSIMTLFHPTDNDDFLDWFYIRDPSHIAFYSPKTMAVIAASLDLSVVFCDNRRYITFAQTCPP